MHVVGVDHGGGGGTSVLSPHGSVVEVCKSITPHLVVDEAAKPNEVVGSVDVAELANDARSERLLSLDELAQARSCSCTAR